MGQLVTKAEFARMTKRKPASITQACGRDLGKAVSGGLIDTEHPSAIRYMRNARRRDEHELTTGAPKQGARPSDSHEPDTLKMPFQASEQDIEDTLNALPADIREVLDLTFSQVIRIFGTSSAMKLFLEAVEKIEKIHKTRLDNAKIEGKVVLRDMVIRGIIEPMNTAHKTLMMDGSKTIARGVIERTKAGDTPEACERWVEIKIGDFIKAAKARGKKALLAM